MNDALKKLIERHIAHLDNWAINIKCLIVMHRALQNIHINKAICKKLQKNVQLLKGYQNRNTEKFDIKMYVDMSSKYTNYLKYYIEVCMKTDLLTDPTKTFADEIRKLPTAELLGNYDYFRKFTTMIFQMFQNANFCKQTRLMSNVIFMLLKALSMRKILMKLMALILKIKSQTQSFN